MDYDLRQDLIANGTELENTNERFSDDEELYIDCLRMFLSDTTMNSLSKYVEIGDWDAAFTAAHALKGVAANMGFLPLYQEVSRLVIVIRSGRLTMVEDTLADVKKAYNKIDEIVRGHLGSLQVPQVNAK